jgi:hypothetical protein
MATMLDAVTNPLGPLGLTSLTGIPAKEKPPAPSQAAFPSIERPADPRPAIERQRAEIGVKTEDLDAKIIQNLADQGQFQAQQAKQKVESEAQGLRELDTSRKALEKSLYESPTYKNIQEKSRELAEKSTFNPDQQNAQTLAAVFSIIGAAGFLLGGNNKNTAKSALAAMNGMAEGYAKGRDQYAKDQRQVFETNQKALRGTLDSLEKAFTYEIEQNKGNLEAATRNAKIAALERDASFINANIDKYGLVSTLEQLKSNKKRLETVLDALQKKEDAYKSTLEKEWFSSKEKEAVAQAAQERVRYQEQERTAREQERREDTKRFQRKMAQFRIENRPEKGQGAGQSQRATQQNFIVQRSVNALGGVASAVEALNRLPAGTTAGILPNLTTKDGMFNFIRNSSLRTMTGSEEKAVETLFTGITRNLAAIEASGAATGLAGLSTQLEKLRPVKGDNAYDVALKMADIRRIATENIQPLIDSGLMPKQQAETSRLLVERIEKAIPFTTNEVVDALPKKKSKETMSQAGQRVVSESTRPGSEWSDADERRLQQLEEKARGSQSK